MTSLGRRALLLAGALGLLAVITSADVATGYKLGLFVFYFAPVALAAWYVGRGAGLAFAVAAAACWFLSERLTGHPYSNALSLFWEAFMHLVSFALLALALARVHTDLRRREALLDVISHDLRAPLGALVGQAQLLGRKAGGDRFVAGRVEAILRSAARMDRMIEDLLDSARSASRQLHLEQEPLDLGRYVAELLERSAPVLEPGRLRLVVADGPPLQVNADPARLDRIVLNLVMNALKYSPPGSPVELQVAPETDGRVQLRVADHGPGIASEDLPHVFERFYRGRSTAARGGLGLGLHSVRLLVEAHGGTVRVEPGRGAGTTFVVALPAAPRSPAVADA